MTGEYEEVGQKDVGMRATSVDGPNMAIDALGRGDGKSHDIPRNHGEHGTYHPKNAGIAVAKMGILQQIKSKIPFTEENKARKAADKAAYKEETTIKTSAERILEAMEARDSQAKEEKRAVDTGRQ